MAKSSDFYGGSAAVKPSASMPLAVPGNLAGSGNKPVHFWLIMVGLLFAARVLYESAA